MLIRQEHPSQHLSDYVLELLPPGAEQAVEQHLASCEACRAIVQKEREMARDVRRTLVQATQPPPARLRQLRPVPPAPNRSSMPATILQPVAALALLLVLFLGAVQLNGPGGRGILAYPSATSLVATATHTPTATESARVPGEEATAAAVPLPAQAVEQPLPAPASTPLTAALVAQAGG